MSHNLNFNPLTGKYSFFSVKEKPWHSLGQLVEDYPTSAEAIQHAGLNYQVARALMSTTGHIAERKDGILPTDFEPTTIPGHFATQRMDTGQVLGVVGSDYEVVQNRDAFTFFDAIVGGGEGIRYQTAGALGRGERIFITATLPDYIRVGSDDMVGKYLFLTTSHDGTGSILAAFTPIRIVCQNTLSAAIGNKSNVIRIRHTANAKERLEQAHKIMGIAGTLSAEMEGIFNQWAVTRIPDKDLQMLIRMALAANKEKLGALADGQFEELSAVYRNQCEEVFAYAMMSDTQQMPTTEGTLFGAFNSVTGYFQNVRTYKDDQAKVRSILLGGTAAQRTQKAFDLCQGYARYGAGIFTHLN